MKRILTAAVSVVLFATIYAWIAYTPVSYREINTYYFGFFEIFLFAIIYAGPVYFLAGIPISKWIDSFVDNRGIKSKVAKYVAGLGLYSLAGVLVGIILVILFNGNVQFSLVDVIPLIVYSLAAAILYFHLSFILFRTR